jgi:hypothetical protein
VIQFSTVTFCLHDQIGFSSLRSLEALSSFVAVAGGGDPLP